jgi:hypothetical protein
LSFQLAVDAETRKALLQNHWYASRLLVDEAGLSQSGCASTSYRYQIVQQRSKPHALGLLLVLLGFW